MSFLSTCQVSPHLEDLSLYIYNLCIYISKNRLSLESQMKWIPADARVESFTLDVADRKNGVNHSTLGSEVGISSANGGLVFTMEDPGIPNRSKRGIGGEEIPTSRALGPQAQLDPHHPRQGGREPLRQGLPTAGGVQSFRRLAGA